jgi:hypothetical protein
MIYTNDDNHIIIIVPYCKILPFKLFCQAYSITALGLIERKGVGSLRCRYYRLKNIIVPDHGFGLDNIMVTDFMDKFIIGEYSE